MNAVNYRSAKCFFQVVKMINEEKIQNLLQEEGIGAENSVSALVQKHGKNILLVNHKSLTKDVSPSDITDLISQKLGVEVKVIFTSHDKHNTAYKSKNIKKIIPIMSCKGGVGKSSISAMIAKILAKKMNIGLLDADIYGPSMPILFNTQDKKILMEDKLLQPIISENVKLISMGNMLDSDKAVIWRGPMATKSLYQLLLSSNWGELDFLFVDTPPGTGDINLVLLEKFDIAGVILVTTSSELSWYEIEKTYYMLQKLGVKIIALVENMSYIETDSGKKEYLFGNSDVNLKTRYVNADNYFEMPVLNNDSLKQKITAEFEVFLNRILVD
jgi:ATP-binding protein involved in chromosome partitioning